MRSLKDDNASQLSAEVASYFFGSPVPQFIVILHVEGILAVAPAISQPEDRRTVLPLPSLAGTWRFSESKSTATVWRHTSHNGFVILFKVNP